MERMLDKPVGRRAICSFFNPAQVPVPKLTEEKFFTFIELIVILVLSTVGVFYFYLKYYIFFLTGFTSLNFTQISKEIVLDYIRSGHLYAEF